MKKLLMKKFQVMAIGVVALLGLLSAGCEENPALPGNVVVTLTSPLPNAIYNNATPVLGYYVTEGMTNETVPDDRINVMVGVTGGALDSFQPLGAVHNAMMLPDLIGMFNTPMQADFTMAFQVLNADGTPAVTMNVPFRVDIQVPDVVILEPAKGAIINDASPIVTYSIDDPCYLIPDPIERCYETVLLDGKRVMITSGSPIPFTLSDGYHKLEVVAPDKNGNIGYAESTFYVDSKAQAVVTDPPAGEVTVPDLPYINVTAAEDGKVVVNVTDNSTGAFWMSDSFSVLANQPYVARTGITTPGNYAINVVFTDLAGNVRNANPIYVRMDTAAPSVLVYEPSGIKATATNMVLYDVMDDVTMLQDLQLSMALETLVADPNAPGQWLVASSQPLNPISSGGSLTVNQDGDYRIVVQATDEANNVGFGSSSFTVDTTPPILGVTSPVHGSMTSDPEPVFTSTTSEAVDMYVYFFEGPYRAYTEADRLLVNSGSRLRAADGSLLMDGTYTLVVEGVDKAGWLGATYSTFAINAAGPNLSILNPTVGSRVSNNNVNLKYSVRDAAEVDLYINGVYRFTRMIDPVQPVPRTYEETLQLGDGTYTVTLIARDDAGGFAPYQAEVTFLVGIYDPGVQIQSPNGGYLQPSQDVNVVFDYSNALTVELLLDGRMVDADVLGTLGIASSSTNLATGTATYPLGPVNLEGPHSLTVVVSDGVTSFEASAAFTVDGTAPVVTIASPTEGAVYESDTVSLVFGANDFNQVASTSVSLNGTALTGIESGDTIGPLVPGLYAIEVSATDAAGNTSTTASATFTVLAEVEEDEGTKCNLGAIAGSNERLEDMHECLDERTDRNRNHD